MEKPFGVSAWELGEINVSDITAASLKDKHDLKRDECLNIFGIYGNLSTLKNYQNVKVLVKKNYLSVSSFVLMREQGLPKLLAIRYCNQSISR